MVVYYMHATSRYYSNVSHSLRLFFARVVLAVSYKGTYSPKNCYLSCFSFGYASHILTPRTNFGRKMCFSEI